VNTEQPSRRRQSTTRGSRISTPRNAHEVAAKVRAETPDEPGVVGKAKKALEEVDRQVAVTGSVEAYKSALVGPSPPEAR
jgi:hypothetical protein